MADEALNENEQSALIDFYSGVSVLAMTAKQAGNTLTLELARTILATIESGCQQTAHALREANPTQYPSKDAAPAAVDTATDNADVIELDAYRRGGGYLN